MTELGAAQQQWLRAEGRWIASPESLGVAARAMYRPANTS